MKCYSYTLRYFISIGSVQLFLVVSSCHCLSAQHASLVVNRDQKTVITGTLSSLSDSVKFRLYNYSLFKDWKIKRENVSCAVNEHKFKLELTLSTPVYISIEPSSIFRDFLFIEPGDSINIDFRRDLRAQGNLHGSFSGYATLLNYLFSGIGAEKLICSQQIIKHCDLLFENPKKADRISLFDSVSSMVRNMISIYRHKLSEPAIAYLVSSYIPFSIDLLSKKESRYSVSERLRYVETYIANINVENCGLVYTDNRVISNLIFAILFKNSVGGDSVGFSEEKYKILKTALPNGPVRDKALGIFLNKSFNKGEYSTELKKCAEDYLATSDISNSFNDAIANWVNTGDRNLMKGVNAFPFLLEDTTGKVVELNQFKGRVVLLDFMFSGCGGCAALVPYIKMVKRHFKDNANVVFVSISTDRDKNRWKTFTAKGIFSAPGSIQLYTNGLGADCPITRHYNIDVFPTLVLIDKYGKVVSARAPDPRWDNGIALIKLIEDAL